jgi:quercetin dioxygenase-like cupin family protein
MIRVLTLAMAVLATSVAAQTPSGPARPGPVIRVLATADATSSGQPITLPQGPVRVTLSDIVVPVGGGLPVHKHPFQRYGYVVSGRLLITNLDTGKSFEATTGDLVMDPVDQWHAATVVGSEPVHLLTFDQAPPGASNTVRRDP